MEENLCQDGKLTREQRESKKKEKSNEEETSIPTSEY